jgi:hypothetical protein
MAHETRRVLIEVLLRIPLTKTNIKIQTNENIKHKYSKHR